MYLIDLNYRIIRKSPLYTRKNNNINPALFGAMAVTLHEVLRVQQAGGKKFHTNGGIAKHKNIRAIRNQFFCYYSQVRVVRQHGK